MTPCLGLLILIMLYIDPSGAYQTDKIYYSFTLIISALHRKGSAKKALQFINFDIDMDKQYSEKVPWCH